MAGFDVDAVAARVGEEIGVGGWFTLDQDRVNAFADATIDHQWIHQAGPQADAGPFGGPIAHGFLTLSLIPHLLENIPPVVEDARMLVNYGLDKVRFITPVPVGARIRARATLAGAEQVPGGIQLRNAVTVEIEGAERPAAYIESLVRAYG